MSKIYGPDPTNHYKHSVIYGQPQTSATAPEEVWDGLIWRNSTTGLCNMYLDGQWWPIQAQVDWNITTETDPGFIKNKPSAFTPSSHNHGLITNSGFLGTTGGLALYTSPVEETEGLIIAGLLPVAAGGTGNSTLDLNSVLVGNGVSAIKKVTSSNGALFSTETGGAPSFGTLPVAQGGTGATTFAENSIILGNTASAALKSLNSTVGALYVASAGGVPQYGTLPVSKGGTGVTTLTLNSLLCGGADNTLAQITAAAGVLVYNSETSTYGFGSVPIASGGTGGTTKATAASSLGVLPLSGGTLTGTLTTQEINLGSTYLLKLNASVALSKTGNEIIIGNSSYNTFIYRPYLYDGSNSKEIFHKGNITYGTGDPPTSGMSAGDIYLKY